jgi:hypothetical protein
MAVSIDDVSLLQRIRDGEHVFKAPASERAADPEWVRLVERLISLRERGLIRMPDPKRSHMSRAGGYLAAGPCDLIAAGFDLLDQAGEPA